MSPDEQVRFSKFLSLVLRHEPEAAGVSLDEAGWVAVAALIAGCRAHGWDVTELELAEMMRSAAKARLVLSEDGLRIRAMQGHSAPVQLDYAPAAPPELLFHGTVARFLASIALHGLTTGARTHVHLSATESLAAQVGQRRGKPVIVRVEAARMAQAGHLFFLAPNGVWLTGPVPPAFLRLPG